MEYTELDDLKYIKKYYGEKMSHLCRELFPVILEKPGLLFHILSSHFEKSKFLYFDIINANKKYLFKEYIYHFYDKNKDDKNNVSSKSVKQLLAEAGYDLFECKSYDDILKFKKYYADGEELCTFNDPDRIKNHYIFFIVKKDVDKIKRKDFKYPSREDDYSVSVLDLQFDKGYRQRISIKSRYNHTVSYPDATYSNNLEAIKPGLSSAFEKDYGFNISSESLLGFELSNYVLARDNKYYKYNYEINNIHYCLDNIIIDNGEVIDKYKDKSRYLFMDYFIVDLHEKKVFLYDKRLQDSFIHGFNNIKKINIIKNENKEVEFTLDDNKKIKVILDNQNRIISYENKYIQGVGEGFLLYNEVLEEIDLPNLEFCKSYFLTRNKKLTSLDFPKLDSCGYFFVDTNVIIEEINLPKLSKCGESFLYSNKKLKELILPNLEMCESDFLFSNSIIDYVYLPKLFYCGNYFLFSNLGLKSLELPSLEEAWDSFINENKQISHIYFPNLVEINGNFLESNTSLKEIYLPNLEKCYGSFLKYNNSVEIVYLPNLLFCGSDFMKHNEVLKKLIVPKLESCEDDFLSDNNDLEELELLNLYKCGSDFLNNNSKLRKIYLPNLKDIDEVGFLKSVKKLDELDISSLLENEDYSFEVNFLMSCLNNSNEKGYRL